MSDKNHDKIMRDRRKAQHDLIELKKMQQGEIPVPPRLINDVTPDTLKEKNDNFWFYNKYKMLAIVLTVAVLAVTINQCLSKEKYDCTVVLALKQSVSEEVVSVMEQQLEQFCGDYDGNGEVNVQVIDCSYNPDSGDQQFAMAKATKYQVQFTSPESVLFILDQESIGSFDELMEGGLADSSIGLPDYDGKALDLKGTAFGEAVSQVSNGYLDEDYYIVKRKVEGTAIDSKKNVSEYNQQAVEILTKMVQAYSK